MTKYEFSNAEIHYTINGKLDAYKACDFCGKLEKSNAGIEYRYQLYGDWGTGRIGLCRKCAKQVQPLVRDFFKNIEKIGTKIAEENAEQRAETQEKFDFLTSIMG